MRTVEFAEVFEGRVDEVIANANANSDGIQAPGQNPVEAMIRLFASADIMVGLWSDVTKPLGIGCGVIQGLDSWDEIYRIGSGKGFRMGFFRFDDQDQAELAWYALGDGTALTQ